MHPKLIDWYNIAYPESEVDLTTCPKEELDLIISYSPWYKSTAEDLTPSERVEVQSILQKYTTHSISSTVNVANDVTEDFIREIYEHANKMKLKGITVYRDGSRSGILVKTPEIISSHVERPVELECKVEQFKNEKKEWVAFIGLMNGRPFEIFTGPKDYDVFPIPTAVKDGVIIKVKQPDMPSRYDFRYVDSYGYTNTLGGLSRIFDKEYWNYARFVSALLQTNTPIDRIIKIVEGLSFTNKGMNSWKAGLIRSLKPYVADGTPVHGAKCENCGSTNVVYESGCAICRDCGSSKCG